MSELPEGHPYSIDVEFAKALLRKDSDAQALFAETYREFLMLIASVYRRKLNREVREELVQDFLLEICTAPDRYLTVVADESCSLKGAVRTGLSSRILDVIRRKNLEEKYQGTPGDKPKKRQPPRRYTSEDPEFLVQKRDELAHMVAVGEKQLGNSFAFTLLLWRFDVLKEDGVEAAERVSPFKKEWQALIVERNGTATLQELWDVIKLRVSCMEEPDIDDGLLADVLGITVNTLQQRRSRISRIMRAAGKEGT